jgi:hypothetical protein
MKMFLQVCKWGTSFKIIQIYFLFVKVGGIFQQQIIPNSTNSSLISTIVSILICSIGFSKLFALDFDLCHLSGLTFLSFEILIVTVPGLCCLGLAFIPKSAKYAILSVYLLGKGASGAGFQMVWMYTNELYPTNLRGQVQYQIA